MEKQTKILIGLAVLGAAAYLYFRPKSGYKSDGSCAEGYDSFGSTGKIICEKKCDEGYEREMSIGGIGKCVKKELSPTPKDYTVKCKDGTTDVGNGVSLPCQGVHGGVVGGSMANTFCPEGSTEEIEMCKQAPCPPSCKKNDGSGYIPCYMNPNCRALIAPSMGGMYF